MNQLSKTDTGRLIVVSAPSGAGKTSLCKIILKKFPELSYSISHTTWSPRGDDIDGIDYFFITVPEFWLRIEKNLWAEWARVHDNYYGTSMEFIRKTVESGSSLLLDIDVQGAKQIKQSYPEATAFFIMAPSMEVLELRLRNRGTDSEDVIKKRLDNALHEIEQKGFYDYVIVNDDLDEAGRRMTQILERVLD